MIRTIVATVLVLSCCAAAFGQIVVPGADGSDGAFNPTSSVTVDLSLAPDGTWNGPNASPGNGVYDVNKWAIVFRYSSVNIPAGVTVTFRNHDWNGLKGGNPPVVWLVSGSVVISGWLRLPGNYEETIGFAIPGPGGFRTAGANASTGGLGPGGGDIGQEGFYGSSSRGYGNARNIPLIGGSGCGYLYCTGGGGAILLVAPGTISINGAIDANTDGSSAGGALRIACDRLEGAGSLEARNYQGGHPGRIRIEANQLAFGSLGNPVPSFGLPGATAQIWPEDATDPSVRVVSLGSPGNPALIPDNPAASFEFPKADVNVTSGTGQVLTIEAHNVPTGSDPVNTQAWNVVARIVPRGGSAPFTVNATYASGNYATSVWTATLNLPNGFAAVQVRASMPPQ